MLLVSSFIHPVPAAVKFIHGTGPPSGSGRPLLEWDDVRNRFVMMIKSGEIDSVPALKTEFKILAKSHHPDLRGPGADGEGFVGLRQEYEIALRNFEYHRFGFRPPESGAALDPGRLPATLAALLKRGFPKTPRHEKETQRYEYLTYAARAQANARREGGGELFREFEGELLGLRAQDARLYRDAMGLLEGIIVFGERPLAGIGTANAVGLAQLERAVGRGSPLCRFFALLMGRATLE
jgi:hypothetical protein